MEQVYAVRTSEDFATQAEAAFDWLEQKADFETAEDWRAGLQEAKASLATLPARCVRAEEDQFYQKSTPARHCEFCCTGMAEPPGDCC